MSTMGSTMSASDMGWREDGWTYWPKGMLDSLFWSDLLAEHEASLVGLARQLALAGLPAEVRALIAKLRVKAQITRDLQAWSNVQGSRAEFTSGFKGVYTRKGISGYMVSVHPAKWNQEIFKGPFKTPLEAAHAHDAAVFYSGQHVEYNYPELKGTFPPLPSHLRLCSVEHHEEITNFVRKQIPASARKFKNSGMMDPTLNLSQALIKNWEIEPARCTIEAKLNEENELAEDLDHEHTLEESDRHESSVWLSDTDSEDEPKAIGSEAEITEDSPCTRTFSDAAGRKRKSCTNEDDLISKLTPFVKKLMEDALNSTFLPLVSVLRTREENEQKHREKLLALENEKLALKRKKLQFKRRRVAQSQLAPKTTRLGHKSRLRLRTQRPAL